MVLAPVLKPFAVAYPRASIDVWIENISIDFVAEEAAQASRQTLEGYELLLEGAGFTLSVGKTGFLASSVAAKNALNLFRKMDSLRFMTCWHD